jgi:hypothetical protein
MKQIQELRESTARLDAHILHQACAAWQQRERSCLLVVLIHIAEIAKRGLHLDRGFMHLGDYCQQHLGLSEGEAWSRVYVAKASNTHPKLLVALGAGNISLAVAALLARHLTVENCDNLLQRCAGKSKRWVEEMLASMGKTQPPQRSSLRPVFVTVLPQDESSTTTTSAAAAPAPAPAPNSAPHTESSLFTGTATTLPFVAEATPPAAPPTQHQLVHQLRCTINDETKVKLLRLAEILGIVDPLNKLDQLIAKATEIALHAKDPALRSHERKSNASEPKPSQPGMQKISPTTAPEASESTPSALSPAPPPRMRAIPALLRRQVLRRAEFQCEYASADGRRCGQKTGLEIDHRFPFSWGGEHSAQNLAVLCHSHHRRKTDEQQGPWVGRRKA